MKKEDLFKSMSDLDQSLIDETKDEGIEVRPIRVAEGKKRFNYKPVAAAAACCVLLAGTAAAVGINYWWGGINIRQPQSTNGTADYTEPGAECIGPPTVYATSYPESAKYQYKGDYSEFNSFSGVVCIDFAEYYDTYRDLLNACDLAVVGEFIDDPWQDIDPDDYTEVQPLDFNSYNCFKIEKILEKEGATTRERGAEIIINQNYAVKGGSIISGSKLTPMLKGDRWVYFLKYNAENGTYYPLNDYMGRYPDPGYCQVFDRDPDYRPTANQILPAMTNKYGLTDENDFNENIFRTLADILYHEYMPKVQCLYDSENLEMYNITSFELAECPGTVFFVRDGSLYIDQPWSSVSPEGIAVTGQDALHKIYTGDVTGDGNNDVCIQVRSPKNEVGEYILIWDCFDNAVYAVTGETGKYEYYLSDVDGELIAYQSKLTSDGSRGEVTGHEKLSLDMNDCFKHLDMDGHSVRCLQDPEYCASQEGDCPLKSGGHTEYCTVNRDYCSQQEGDCPYTGNHHNEGTSSEHHGHSEYCLQDANYCSQQAGECPYTGSHHNEGTSSEHHGHSEYCLQDTDYCAQQAGECPYTGGHHNEGTSGEHHGHSEYCLQDLDYCVQQEGVCPYSKSCVQYSGHCEHCLEDADYCSQQEGECPYRQSGGSNSGSSSGHSGHHSDGHH